MATELEKLRTLLAELFQLDAADDLDFGMYRVLRLRRDELTSFLENTLTSEVRRAMGAVAEKERDGITARMRQIEEQAAQFNASPEGNAEYVKLRGLLAEASDASARERQVYAHLAEFFSRYYEDGDFLSLPRMKADTYAIPYDGSEVVLHWANKDQYYVKSGEYFARYAFQLSDGRRVVFRLVDAEVDPDNMKSADAGKRRVILAEADGVKLENGELVCRFVFATTEGKQDAVNKETERRVMDAAPPGWAGELAAEKAGQTSKEKYTTLGWHLRQYVEKNKRDYFIHKDLGGFLRRELDHYLKTEVFDLDSVEAMGADDVSRAVTMVKTVRAVAKPIITFLASIEDFQKRLFLKKKMVLRTDWCVTLDRVPEEFYAEIAASKAQVARWKELFAIGDIEVPPMFPGGDARGEAVSVEFLKSHQELLVETRLLPPTTAAAIVSRLGPSLDDHVTGVLIRGENSGALRLLRSRSASEVVAVYIDPPYNTGDDGFPYKYNYQHSSWLAALGERLELAKALLSLEGVLLCSIDDNESWRAEGLLRQSFGAGNVVPPFVWKRKAGGGDDSDHVATEHEYICIAARSRDHLALARIAHESPSMTAKYNKKEGERRFYFERLDKTSLTYSQSMDFAIDAPDGTKIWPPQPNPERRTTIWRWGPDTVRTKRDELHFQRDKGGEWRIYTRTWAPDERGVTPRSLLVDKEFGRNRDGTEEIADILWSKAFRNPKPLRLLSHLIRVATPRDADARVVLDFFAGSGTSGHAVLNLNREDNGKRRFILIEVNDYFDTVLLPRILRATYTKVWENGKPKDRTPARGGALYKVLYLESYEDTLANITLPPPPSVNPLPFHLQRDYTIRYMLDHETRQAVLDLDRFRKPFGWTMEVRRGGLVTKDHPVDLVETFNYLIGLHVSRYGYFRDANRIRYVEGVVKEDGNDHRVLVLWRDCDLVPDDELVRLFDDREFAPVSSREYDRIYVNGDPPLGNIKRPDEQWKVLAIEDEFKRLCFADVEA